jgi:glucose-6-phosphate 1-epimerase
LRISHAQNARLEGLRGVRYANRGATAMDVEARDIVTAAEPIDRVYFSTPPVTRLEDAGRMLRIEQRGFTDTVVWNPGRERTAQMPDMPPEGFLHMLCVEAVAFDPPVVLAPGAAWAAGQAITVCRESTSPTTPS